MQFIDLKTQYERLKPEIGRRIEQVLERQAFIRSEHLAGPSV
jgi:hypothetical protein